MRYALTSAVVAFGISMPAFSALSQNASRTVGLPIEFRGVTVTPNNIRPTKTLGGHRTRVVFTVRNKTEKVVNAYVECSFYERGTPAGNDWTLIKSIPPGDEVVGSVPSHADATHASCRPTQITNE